jgi:hypothetical protein
VESQMLSKEKCLEKCQGYLREYHPKVSERLLVEDESARSRYYNSLAEYVQTSLPNLSDDDDLSLLEVFGTDDVLLEQLLEQVLGSE